jgi:excisionase family DNA binding protein
VYETILEQKSGLLTVTELAKLLSVSQRLIYQLVQSGNLPHLRTGATVRFDPMVIVKWLNDAEGSLDHPWPMTLAAARRGLLAGKTNGNKTTG